LVFDIPLSCFCQGTTDIPDQTDLPSLSPLSTFLPSMSFGANPAFVSEAGRPLCPDAPAAFDDILFLALSLPARPQGKELISSADQTTSPLVFSGCSPDGQTNLFFCSPIFLHASERRQNPPESNSCPSSAILPLISPYSTLSRSPDEGHFFPRYPLPYVPPTLRFSEGRRVIGPLPPQPFWKFLFRP